MTGAPPLIPTWPRNLTRDPHIRPAMPGPAVEQRGQVAGGVADLAGQHRVPLHRTDLDHPHPALDGGLARLVDRADRGDAGRRDRPVVTAGAGQRLGLGLGRSGGGRPRPSGAAARRAAARRPAGGRGPGSARAGAFPSRAAWRSLQHVQPVLHVERDDRGRGVRHPADHAGDLVRGAVVQQPAEQRRVAAPGQDRGHLGAGLLPPRGGPVRPRPGPSRRSGQSISSSETLRSAAARRLRSSLGLLGVDDEVHGAQRRWGAGSCAYRSAARVARSKSSTKTRTTRRE